MSIIPRVLMIIVTWNKRDFVLRLLEQIEHQVAYPSLDVLIVDNASIDGTVAAIRAAHPKAKVIANTENLGGTGGFNTGLRYAFEHAREYQYIWLCDNDLTLVGDPLTPAVDLLRSTPEIGAVGMTIVYQEDPTVIGEVGGLIADQRLDGVLRGTALDEASQEVHIVDYVASCSAVYRMKAAWEAGLWDERYFLYYDDVDFSCRIRALGYRILATTRAVVTHPGPTERRSMMGTYFEARNGMYFFRQGPGPRPAPWRLPRPIARLLASWAIGDIETYEATRLALEDYYSGHFGRSTRISHARDRVGRDAHEALLRASKVPLSAPPHAVHFASETNYDEAMHALNKLAEVAPSCRCSMSAPKNRDLLLRGLSGLAVHAYRGRGLVGVLHLLSSLARHARGETYLYAPRPSLADLFFKYRICVEDVGLSSQRNRRAVLWVRIAIGLPLLSLKHLLRHCFFDANRLLRRGAKGA